MYVQHTHRLTKDTLISFRVVGDLHRRCVWWWWWGHAEDNTPQWQKDKAIGRGRV